MIGVDTNVLVRACLEDDRQEAEIAKDFLRESAKNKNLFISSYAILETVWVLKVKGQRREHIYEAILDLIDSPGIIIGKREVVAAALEYYIKGKADFGDYLILAEGEHYNAPTLASFDKVLCKENNSCCHPEKLTAIR